jgi:hypothetical protein
VAQTVLHQTEMWRAACAAELPGCAKLSHVVVRMQRRDAAWRTRGPAKSRVFADRGLGLVVAVLFDMARIRHALVALGLFATACGTAVDGTGAAGAAGQTSCWREVTVCVRGAEVTNSCDTCVNATHNDCAMPDNHVSCGNGTCVNQGFACPSAADAGGSVVGQPCNALQPCSAGADCAVIPGRTQGFCSPGCTEMDAAVCSVPGPGLGGCLVHATPGALRPDHCAIRCESGETPDCPPGLTCQTEMPTFSSLCLPPGSADAGGAADANEL